ncbi:MAG: hypothetical protein LBM64_08675 [Deltaproteobacteria bacterium]|nr:hypothetical protein [Deltaproteobacteria bacterium]
MKTISEVALKRLLTGFMLCAALVLPACGGGGGGGGASNYNPAPALSCSDISAGASEVGDVSADLSEASQGTQANLQAGVDLGGGYMLQEGSLEITKGAAVVAKFETGAGGDVKLYDNGIFSAFFTQVGPDVPKAFSDDLPAAGQNITWNDGDEIYTGSLAYTSQALWLNAGPGDGVTNSNAVALEYSTFGA